MATTGSDTVQRVIERLLDAEEQAINGGNYPTADAAAAALDAVNKLDPGNVSAAEDIELDFRLGFSSFPARNSDFVTFDRSLPLPSLGVEGVDTPSVDITPSLGLDVDFTDIQRELDRVLEIFDSINDSEAADDDIGAEDSSTTDDATGAEDTRGSSDEGDDGNGEDQEGAGGDDVDD